MAPATVVIIGGGVVGLHTAIQLKLRGVATVQVLERHHIGAGQSGRAAGLIRTLVRSPLVAGWLRLARDFYTAFPARFGETLPIHRGGYLLLLDKARGAVADTLLTTARNNACLVELVDADRAQALQPGLRHDPETLYLFEPGAIQFDPMLLTQALARAARRLGVQIVEDCAVGRILVQGDRVVGVDSTQGHFASPVVLAANAVWARPQLQALGVDLPVYPHRIEMAFFHVPPDRQFSLQRCLSDTRSQLYMRPEGERQLFVGWRDGDLVQTPNDLQQVDPDHYRQTAYYDNLRKMQQHLTLTLPVMVDGFVHRTYSCVYDWTSDEMPILDQIDGIAGLYVALGSSGGGISLSPMMGQAMSRLIIDDQPPAEVALLSMKRFATGQLIQWSNAPQTEEKQNQ